MLRPLLVPALITCCSDEKIAHSTLLLITCMLIKYTKRYYADNDSNNKVKYHCDRYSLFIRYQLVNQVFVFSCTLKHNFKHCGKYILEMEVIKCIEYISFSYYCLL